MMLISFLPNCKLVSALCCTGNHWQFLHFGFVEIPTLFLFRALSTCQSAACIFDVFHSLPWIPVIGLGNQLTTFSLNSNSEMAPSNGLSDGLMSRQKDVSADGCLVRRKPLHTDVFAEGCLCRRNVSADGRLCKRMVTFIA